MKLRVVVLSVVMFSLVGCAQPNDDKETEITKKEEATTVSVKELSPKDAAKEIANGVQLIDVRGDSEFKAYHIDGSKNIPIDEFDAAIPTLDKTKPVYVVCEVGLRSTTAAKKLANAGFSDVRHIEGGLRAWQKEGLPVKEGK